MEYFQRALIRIGIVSLLLTHTPSNTTSDHSVLQAVHTMNHDLYAAQEKDISAPPPELKLVNETTRNINIGHIHTPPEAMSLDLPAAGLSYDEAIMRRERDADRIDRDTPAVLNDYISRSYPMAYVIPLFLLDKRGRWDVTALIRHAGGIYEIPDTEIIELMTDDLATHATKQAELRFLIDLFCKQASLMGVEQARFYLDWHNENNFIDAEAVNVRMYMWFVNPDDIDGFLFDRLESTADYVQRVLEQITERNGPVKHMLGVLTLMSIIGLGKDDAIAADGTRLVHYATTAEHVRQLKLAEVDFTVRDSAGKHVIDHMREHGVSL